MIGCLRHIEDRNIPRATWGIERRPPGGRCRLKVILVRCILAYGQSGRHRTAPLTEVGTIYTRYYVRALYVLLV